MTERERLIEFILECDKSNEVLSCFNERPRKRQAAEIFADYLLANGVIVPPCKVGDTVYQTDSCRVYESEIDYIEVHGFVTIFYTDGVAFDERAIGGSIFLSREDAEKALAERSKG